MAGARHFGLVGLRLALLAQRGQGLCWVPVCLATGIGTYFALRFEPGVGHYAAAVGVILLLGWLSRNLDEAFAPMAIALALCLAGFSLAGLRAHAVAEPVLGWRYYGPVEGRVIAMDRSQSDALRLTLDQVRLDRVPPARTPARVRISLHDKGGVATDPEPGLRVMTTGHLSPPSGPVEPGGFDFQRHAWFAGLGAVGYTRVPLLGVAPAAEGQAGLAIFRLRMAASARIRSHLAGDVGGFAAAVTTGDRSAISQTALEHLRISNLAHLLAISGLHMGLLSAVVFGALRLGLAAVPALALRWPTKKIAAFGALMAAVVYLALSGGNVATQRAFVMVAVALGALMLGRRALSLRAVAVAATIVLVLRPEALMGPGFQMSFAATTALVAVFGVISRMESSPVPAFLRPAAGVFISSAVAGLATAPIAAAHFNAIAHYGLVANLASVPLMGALVIPAAVLALVMAPLGLEGVGLWVMGLGLRWILGVAEWVATLEGARGYVPGPGPWVLPLIALGGLTLVLWQGRGRWTGLAPLAVGFLLWHQVERPAVLIADKGTLVGWMTPGGRVLSKEKGAGFIARNWLENDGDGAQQWQAAKRPVTDQQKRAKVVHLAGKRAVAAHGVCGKDEIIVASVDPEGAFAPDCALYDPARLRQTGAIALYPAPDGWRRVTARSMTGERLWTRWPEEKDQ
ncbi:MAG: DUF4131 domain-containing protein [Sulfitobacter sp.]|nr:DUF4131 domain-containing protein [Sulfitobacter sp.]